MPECRHCGAALESSYRFCPMCATPQTDEARRRLKRYVEARNTGGSDPDLETRVRYAVGFVAVVAGLSTLTAVGGVFFLLAGVFVLPPVGRLLEAQVGRPLEPPHTAGGAGLLVAVGVAVLLVL